MACAPTTTIAALACALLDGAVVHHAETRTTAVLPQRIVVLEAVSQARVVRAKAIPVSTEPFGIVFYWEPPLILLFANGSVISETGMAHPLVVFFLQVNLLHSEQ